MKHWILSALILFSLPAFADEKTEEIDYDRLSETLGHLIVRQLNQPGFSFQLDRVIQGMKDEQAGKPSPLAEEEYEQMVCTLQEQQFVQVAEQNLAQANTFLHQNAAKKGMKTVDEEKLQYEISHEGNGESVGPDSIPLIYYKGQLIDGTIFASSEGMSQPIALPIKQSIPGFAKGIVGMKEGEKRVLYIHPELAYGLSGQLPPNSLLIFEVEVVKANAVAGEIAQQDVESKIQTER